MVDIELLEKELYMNYWLVVKRYNELPIPYVQRFMRLWPIVLISKWEIRPSCEFRRSKSSSDPQIPYQRAFGSSLLLYGIFLSPNVRRHTTLKYVHDILASK
jgi:hypothetical protein